MSLIYSIYLKVILFIAVLSESTIENASWPTLSYQLRNNLVSTSLPFLEKLNSGLHQSNVTRKCKLSLKLYIDEVFNLIPWAVYMADATGKFPSGITHGALSDFGFFDECLRIRTKDIPTNHTPFKGQHCMVTLTVPFLQSPSPSIHGNEKPPDWVENYLMKLKYVRKVLFFGLGICIPSTCTEQEIHHLADIIWNGSTLNVTSVKCQTDDTKSWPSMHLMIYMCCFLSLTFIGTSYDVAVRYCIKQKEVKIQNVSSRLLTSFSVVSNTGKLLECGAGTDLVGCFHGMRTISAIWIMIGHHYFVPNPWYFVKYRNLEKLLYIRNTWLFLIVKGFSLPVAIFFFISGYLLAHTALKSLKNRDVRKLTFFSLIFHKYYRLIWSVLYVIILTITLANALGGPIFPDCVQSEIKQCVRSWWSNVIFTNNLVDKEETCFLHTWYVSAVFQLHFVGAVLLKLFYRSPIAAKIIGSVIVFFCSLAIVLIAFNQNYENPSGVGDEDLGRSYDFIYGLYLKPYYHFATYLIGMVTAYAVHEYKNVKLPEAVCWIVSALLALSCIIGVQDSLPYALLRAVFHVYFRVAFTFSVAWLTFACATGRARRLNRFLSQDMFVIFGRISYMFYLVHPPLIFLKTAMVRERVHFDYDHVVKDISSTLLVSLLLAFFIHVSVELPFINIRAIFSAKKTNSNNEHTLSASNDTSSNLKKLH